MSGIPCSTHCLNKSLSIRLTATLALLLAIPKTAAASNFVWQGSCLPNGWNDRCYVGPCRPPPGDLYVNNWGNSACSADPALPGIGDDVSIAAPYTVTFGGSGAARNLTCDGFLDSYATLSLGQSATINGRLRFSGGAVIGPASVTISPGAFLDVRAGEELRQITFTNRGYAYQATDRNSQFLTSGSRFYNEGTFELQSWGAIAGDADPACAEKCSIFTPVPGGVGPLAVACLFSNVVTLAERTM